MTRFSEQQARELLGDRYPEPEKKAHKYNAQKKSVDGITFDSQKEAGYYAELVMRKRAGDIKDFTLQPEFILQDSFKRNGKTIRAIKYIADFKIIYPDGREEIVDVKSSETFQTKEYRIKKKLLLYKYPELDFKEVY